MDKEYVSCLKYIYSNGEFENPCSDVSTARKSDDLPACSSEYYIPSDEELYWDEELEPCDEGWYPIEGTDSCCPEPDMIIVGEYCAYGLD